MANQPVLSAADHEHFLEHGYVVLKNGVEPDVIRDAIAGFQNKQFTGTVGGSDYKPVANEAVVRCYGPRFFAALSELYGQPAPVHAIHGMHMPRIHEPDKTWSIPGAHIDDDYPTPMPAAWAVGSFVFLTPVKYHGGAFVYFAGSYRRYRALMSHHPWSLKAFSGEVQYSGPPAELLAEPGDILLFHHLEGHTGSINTDDPTTRQSLLARHHPPTRVVPGSKPFEAMSTIEKANSTRYLRHRFGDAFALPALVENQATSDALAAGFADAGGRVLAAVPHHGAGRAWLFYVQSDSPSKIRAVSSDDWLSWRAECVIETSLSTIHDVSIFQREQAVYLCATGAGGAEVFSSGAPNVWKQAGQLAGVTALCGHYTTGFGSKIGKDFIALTLSAGDEAIRARWDVTFEKALGGTQNAVSFAGVPGQTITGFTLLPTLGEGEFAMVLDVGESGASVPYAVKSRDAVLFSQAAEPLAFDAPSAPRHVRVYHRARDYWLVTYVRAGRIFWGVIDWSGTPRLREVRDASALRAALEIVGLY